MLVSPLLPTSSSALLLLVILRKDGDESIFLQILLSLTAPTHHGPRGSGAVRLKMEKSCFLSWWTAEPLHGILVYIRLGLTLQDIW